ncbi:hypothetical protein SLEP1_g23493 [Rubroshorea leprosula]|uniref:Uncharacterized protein n=1 Tax=Rubroshorea leprosula TaxID=152421 RepID=A0AAV5JHS8_9ROSI|nr:hypothetical protein SLEP1_g23493 [Rubroshorea leprosula]
MLLIEPIRSSDPASGGYTPANSVACQWEAIHIYLLSDLIVFPCLPLQEAKSRTGKNEGSDELEG